MTRALDGYTVTKHTRRTGLASSHAPGISYTYSLDRGRTFSSTERLEEGAPMSKKKPEGPRALTMKLDVALNQAEKTERTTELIEAMQRVDDLVTQKSEQTANINAEIKLGRQLVKEKRIALKDGKEKRDVECLEEHDYRLQQVKVVRSDTKEVVTTRAMSIDERQGQLQGLDERDGTMTTTLGDSVKAKAKRAKKTDKGTTDTSELAAKVAGEEPFLPAAKKRAKRK